MAFAGIETVSQQIDARAKTHVHFDYWTADATVLKFKLVDFGANGVYNGVGVADDVEHEIIIETGPQRQWVSVDSFVVYQPKHTRQSGSIPFIAEPMECHCLYRYLFLWR